jgi:DHA2 family multidrug resistance protein
MPKERSPSVLHGRLNHEVTRQAAMVAYNDDFALMLGVILASLPLLPLIRGPRRQPMLAAADD